MVVGIILFAIAIVLIVMVIYSTFCWTPGKESRKEEKDNG